MGKVMSKYIGIEYGDRECKTRLDHAPLLCLGVGKGSSFATY